MLTLGTDSGSQFRQKIAKMVVLKKPTMIRIFLHCESIIKMLNSEDWI